MTLGARFAIRVAERRRIARKPFRELFAALYPVTTPLVPDRAESSPIRIPARTFEWTLR